MSEKLMELAVAEDNVGTALGAVIGNRGAAGIDHMPVGRLEEHLRKHWDKIRAKLLTGTWCPAPVKRVEIPKPNGGTRMLGIPTVVDRFIQQLLLQVMTPIFEPGFSTHSYGFRPGRSAHDAVRAAKQYASEGKDWVVDMDITKFFDRVQHDILMSRIGTKIRDKRVLRLIGRYLRAGALVEGVVVRSEEGTPQGGPLSPLLANIYLDALDQELMRRGHRFSRYADDCNIYVSSESAARRVLTSIKTWIEQRLRLQLNDTKSGVGRTWERKFLGFRINQERQIEVAPESLKRFREKVQDWFQGNRSVTEQEQVTRWQQWIRGWWGYYRLAENRQPIQRLESGARRHIRKWYWLRWHGWQGRKRWLTKLGVNHRAIGIAYSTLGAWRIAATPAMQQALPNRRIHLLGYLLPSALTA